MFPYRIQKKIKSPTVKKICSISGDNPEFVTLWCRCINMHASKHQVRLRNYPQYFMDFTDWKLCGKFCGAEQKGLHSAQRTGDDHRTSCMGHVQAACAWQWETDQKSHFHCKRKCCAELALRVVSCKRFWSDTMVARVLPTTPVMFFEASIRSFVRLSFFDRSQNTFLFRPRGNLLKFCATCLPWSSTMTSAAKFTPSTWPGGPAGTRHGRRWWKFS